MSLTDLGIGRGPDQRERAYKLFQNGQNFGQPPNFHSKIVGKCAIDFFSKVAPHGEVSNISGTKCSLY